MPNYEYQCLDCRELFSLGDEAGEDLEAELDEMLETAGRLEGDVDEES